MPLFPSWADLPSDLLCRISESLDDKCYTSSRGACTPWRCALAPLYPSLLVFLDYYAAVAVSLLANRSIELKPIPSGGRCVGSSSNGWLALSVGGKQGMFSLFHPLTATEIDLPPLTYESGWVAKIVFTPHPTADDFAAAAICACDRLAYVTAGTKRWAVLDPVHLARGDQFTDLVYHESGRVYCITRYGDVHVLRLPERRCRELFMVEHDLVVAPAMTSSMSAHAARLAALRFQSMQTKEHHNMLLRRSFGPDLNDSATVEPLLPNDGNLRFDPANSFAPPYNTISVHTTTKSLVFCEGNLYQIWRNASCAVGLRQSGGGCRRVALNEIFVLRYYPQRQPCWDAVTDLGGYSVFVGRNNAVSMYAEGVPGLKGNSVYWIGGSAREHDMVFDMATGTSTPCLTAAQESESAIFWYFLSDGVNKCDNSN